ncbi:MAG TPA: hypothetical protein PK613_19170 [Anaerolineaceae bacterium]|nr:hypothetical protein [Anaerolineaceae bacterium]
MEGIKNKPLAFCLNEPNPMIDIISKYLKEGANPTFRYQPDPLLHKDLAKIIIQQFESSAILRDTLPHLETLIVDHDYRLVAEYLAARKNHHSVALSLFGQMFSEKERSNPNKYRFEIAHSRFLDINSLHQKSNVIFTCNMDEIFSKNQERIIVWLQDDQYKDQLMTLIDVVGTKLGAFLEQQYDMPGLNAIVRQGIVRYWHLPNNIAVVSKRESSYKKGRFEKEQTNYKILLQKFGQQPLTLRDPENPKNKIVLQIAYPFAIIYDGYSDKRYALSLHIDATSLEEILLTEKDNAHRSSYLTHYRLLLDILYENGILWGDMSPRNILVDQREGVTTYTLLDFEKTHFLNQSASYNQRVEHCRGQICIEEMGVLCQYDEMLACFRGYFNPTEWDLTSNSLLPFVPRPDIFDILRGRGIEQINLGDYNTIDHSILAVRIPYNDPFTKSLVFPGHIGFKVEHYLSCAGYANAGDYDRKTTEILIAAKIHGCFEKVVRLLLFLANSVEIAYIKREFLDILSGGFSGNLAPPKQEIGNLINALDVFYQTRESGEAYRDLCARWLSDLQIGLGENGFF